MTAIYNRLPLLKGLQKYGLGNRFETEKGKITRHFCNKALFLDTNVLKHYLERYAQTLYKPAVEIVLQGRLLQDQLDL